MREEIGIMLEPKTLFDKIWESHLVDQQDDGTCLIYIDRQLIHEITSAQAFDGLRQTGRRARRPEANLCVPDHNVPTTPGRGGTQEIEDEEFLISWFRDQVLHPHETQHTPKEVVSWADECNLQLIETSINRFKPIKDVEELYIAEEDYEQLSRRRNFLEKKYFPGFFTCLFRKTIKIEQKV